MAVGRDSIVTMSRLTCLLAAIVLLPACANSLPDQDRRILSAVAVAKLPVEDLWKDYQQNAADADGRYRGKAIEISGKVSSKVTGDPATGTSSQILFGTPSDTQVRAHLLDDQAAALLAAAVEGQRIRLKCYCAGLSGAVVVKSCVQP